MCVCVRLNSASVVSVFEASVSVMSVCEASASVVSVCVKCLR